MEAACSGHSPPFALMWGRAPGSVEMLAEYFVFCWSIFVAPFVFFHLIKFSEDGGQHKRKPSASHLLGSAQRWGCAASAAPSLFCWFFASKILPDVYSILFMNSCLRRKGVSGWRCHEASRVLREASLCACILVVCGFCCSFSAACEC